MKGLFVVVVPVVILIHLASATDELLILLLDTSGSMRGQEEAMVAGVNEVLSNMTDTLQRARSSWNGTFNVQIYAFSDVGGPTKRLLLEAPLHTRPQITLDHYRCDGGTPLYDVVGGTLAKLPNGATLVIATDGEDTTSRSYTQNQIAKALKREVLVERDIHLVYVYKGVEAEREAANIANMPRQTWNNPTHSDFYMPMGSILTHTFASNVAASAGVFRHVG